MVKVGHPVLLELSMADPLRWIGWVRDGKRSDLCPVEIWVFLQDYRSTQRLPGLGPSHSP
jgi:hypothetical protein